MLKIAFNANPREAGALLHIFVSSDRSSFTVDAILSDQTAALVILRNLRPSAVSFLVQVGPV